MLFALELYVCSHVAMILHELGHALAAVAVGYRVPVLSIGGAQIKPVRLRCLFLLIRISPVEGRTVLRPPSTRHYRKKMALVLIAATAVNLLCAAGAAKLLASGVPSGLARDVALLCLTMNSPSRS